jgi:biopolymer transport protein TolR
MFSQNNNNNKEGRNNLSSNYKFMSEINITPFVDVMLVLLVIFMVTAPMLEHGIKVHLPAAAAHAIKSPEKTIVVSINGSREVYINALKVGLPTLTSKLRAIYKNRTNKEIFLKADSSIPYGVVIRVMAAVKMAGISKIGMVTKNPILIKR